LKQYEEAIKAYKQVTKYKPDYADAWCALGLAHAELQQHEEAIKAYKQAIKYKPDYADAWYRRGLAHNGLQQHEEAIGAVLQSIKIEPNILEIWAVLGLLYAFNNQTENAKIWLCRAWQSRSSLSEDLATEVQEKLEELEVDPNTCGEDTNLSSDDQS
ncbi:MAG: tetratricopeptide repeat protein, partial [Bacteroidota bacterium]